MGNVSDKYRTDITPANWTFLIWAAIYIWQAVWIMYTYTALCRQGIDGYLYYSPNYLPPMFYLFYILSLLFSMAWVFLYDREFIHYSTACLALVTFTAYLSLVFSYRALQRHLAGMYKNNLRFDIWATRLFVQNGIAFYATWVTIATLLNFNSALVYLAKVEMELCGTIILGILTAEICVYFIVENFICEKYLRYTFSVYATLAVALTGILHAHWDPTKRNAIFSAVIAGLAGLFLLLKIVLACCRHARNPLHRSYNVNI